MAEAPPILDFSVFYGSDAVAKAKLVQDVKKCCLHNGFFQIVGHKVPSDLQEKIFEQSEKFFSLPEEEKLKYSKELNTWNRGFELIHSQMLEAGTSPELKEGFYIGEDLDKSHPYFLEKKLNSGPNVWPEDMPGVEEFKKISMEYYRIVCSLAKDILAVLAATLDLPATFFDEFAKDAVATMRLLHYPPQPADADEKLARGIGAHTDFGAVTLLLQGGVDGLQVWEKTTEQWLDVVPVKGAYVVNLGNMFMRWSNDRYISNLHRVINKSGLERYSIPVFFSGNPDYIIDCLPNCRKESEPAKYPPVSVQTAVSRSYQESYGRAQTFKKTEIIQPRVLQESFGAKIPVN